MGVSFVSRNGEFKASFATEIIAGQGV